MNNSKKVSSHSILITGFPGFLGSHLLTTLAKTITSARFYLLVQPAFIEQAESLLGKLNSELPGLTTQTEIIPGDITAARMGIPFQQYTQIYNELTMVFHLAAIYDLSVQKQIAYSVNLEGTKTILQAIQGAPNLQQFVYFSTCFVAGNRIGTILETELDCGQSFKNFYEETKFKAELEVQKLLSRIPTIIIRPAIVVGDSKTGAIPKFDGPYYIIRLLAKLEKRHLLPKGMILPRIGASKAHINLTPVDYLLAVIQEIIKSEWAIGKTFQVVDPSPAQVIDLYKAILAEFGLKVVGCVPGALVETLVSLPILKKVLEIPPQVVTYFNYAAQFDSQNVQTVLKDTGITCPDIMSYLHAMVEYTRSTL